MAVDIKNLIGTVNPKLYCQNADEVAGIVKEKGYLAAAGKAKLKDSLYIDYEALELVNPFKLPKITKNNPIEQHSLTFDATGEALEPIYFWVIDALYKDYKDMKLVDKVVDNFSSTVGSGFFSDRGQRAKLMQDAAIKILGDANQIIKLILNLIYDLKEFRLRLRHYDDYKGKDEKKKAAALLSLKQIWMDQVDIKKGNGSINMLAQQLQFVTIRDAFLSVNTLEAAEKLDLNDRVKRMLLQRIKEFNDWIEESERELRKRYEIEKIYLKSEVNSIRLYARWAKPYLKAAKDLEQANPNPKYAANLVNAFNTALFELVLLGQSDYKPEDDVRSKDLPQVFLTPKRKYIPLIVVELRFRSIPERVTQQGGYVFRGKLEAVFTSFALNEQELKIVKTEMEKDDLGDIYQAIEGATDESLGLLQTDIDDLLGDKEEKKAEEKKKEEEDTNPFSALISFFKSDKKKEEKKDDKNKKIEADDDLEQVIRAEALIKARKECLKIYGLYKKSHGMPAI